MESHFGIISKRSFLRFPLLATGVLLTAHLAAAAPIPPLPIGEENPLAQHITNLPLIEVGPALTRAEQAAGHLTNFYNKYRLELPGLGKLSFFNEPTAWQHVKILERLLGPGGPFDEVVRGASGNAAAVIRDLERFDVNADFTLQGGVTLVEPGQADDPGDDVQMWVNPDAPQAGTATIHEFLHGMGNSHPLVEAFTARVGSSTVDMSSPTQEAMAFAFGQIVQNWDPNLIKPEELALTRRQVETHGYYPLVVGGRNTPDWLWAYIDTFRMAASPNEELFLITLQSLGAELADRIVSEIPADKLGFAMGQYMSDPRANKGMIGAIVARQQNDKYIPRYGELPETLSGLSGFAGVDVAGGSWVKAPDGSNAVLIRPLSFDAQGDNLNIWSMTGATAYYFDSSGNRHDISPNDIGQASIHGSDHPVIFIKDQDKKIPAGAAVIGIDLELQDKDGKTGTLSYILPFPEDATQSSSQQLTIDSQQKMIDNINANYSEENPAILSKQLTDAWKLLEKQRGNVQSHTEAVNAEQVAQQSRKLTEIPFGEKLKVDHITLPQ